MREELMAAPFVALTDHRWFEYLRSKADDRGRLDEANFWLPSAQRPTAKFAAATRSSFVSSRPTRPSSDSASSRASVACRFGMRG